MTTLVSGIVVLLLTGLVFAYMMPRGGRLYRFAGTEVEPYVAVAFTASVALGLTLMLSGVIELIGT
ncbi:MAG TPA: hypothetical protein VG966_03335 [Hyphomicrobiaceae bacterium]|jgi:hypothetical protein|nr:hypothetical protein [Hyphomicrobiaceae bacterium]